MSIKTSLWLLRKIYSRHSFCYIDLFPGKWACKDDNDHSNMPGRVAMTGDLFLSSIVDRFHILCPPFTSFSYQVRSRHPENGGIKVSRSKSRGEAKYHICFEYLTVLLILAKKTKSCFSSETHCVQKSHHQCCKTIFNLPLLQTRNEKVGNICDGFIMNANQDGSLGSDRLSKYESTWEPQSPRGNKIWIIPSGSCAATAGNLPPLWSTLFWHLRTNFDLWSFIVPIMTVKQVQKYAGLEDPKMVRVSGFLNSLASFWAQLRIVCVQVNSNQRGFMFLICILCLCKWKVCWGEYQREQESQFLSWTPPVRSHTQ